jgi:hypothetical protein
VTGDMGKRHAINMVDTMPDTDKIIGAIAFSRAGDQATNAFEDALIIDRYCETPETVEGLK